MAQIVKLRRSSVSGQKPTNSNLQLGELALNTTDGKVYMAKSGSLGPSVEELISTNTVNTGSVSISGSFNLEGNQSITGSLLIGTGSFHVNNPEILHVQNSGSFNIAHFEGNNQYYTQINVKNTNSGSGASGDVVITADNGTESIHYVDLGINSSTYDAGYVGYANDAYLINAGKDLYVGTLGGPVHPSNLNLFAQSNWENPQIQISGSKQISFNTSSVSSGYTYEFSGSIKADHNLNVVGHVTANQFTGSALGLTNVPFHISGSDISGNTYNKTFTKLQFDDSTGLNVNENDPGTAFISIGSHFKDIFVSGSPILSATGSDAFEIIPTGGIEITTSITDTNANGYVKELTISTTNLSASINDRIDIITGSIDSLNGFSSSVVLTSQTGSMTVLSASYAVTAAFALNAGGSGGVALGSYNSLVVTSAASTWSFQHDTGQQYPIFQVFDSNGFVVIPSQIQTIDDNNANIIFPSPQTGRVIASLGGGNGTTQPFTNSNIWTVNHNLGTDYPDVTVWDSNRNIIFPNRIESVTTNQIKIYFSQAISGNVSVSRGGHILSGSAVTISGLISGSSQISNLGYATTGSNNFVGSQSINGCLSINNAKICSTAVTISSNTEIFNLSTFDGAFFDYVVKNGTNMRAGSIMSAWNGTDATYNETTTMDLGNTNPIEFNVSGTGRLNATVNSGTWTVEVLYRALGDGLNTPAPSSTPTPTPSSTGTSISVTPTPTPTRTPTPTPTPSSYQLNVYSGVTSEDACSLLYSAVVYSLYPTLTDTLANGGILYENSLLTVLVTPTYLFADGTGVNFILDSTSQVIDNPICSVSPSPTPTPTRTPTPTPTSTTYSVGQTALGGKIAYILQSGDPGYDANVQHGLIATSSDISESVQWGCEGTRLTGANGSAIGTGNQNTIDIITECTTSGIAAKLCSDLTTGGYSDWYLPSKDELNKLYLNRVAIGGFTTTSGFSNYWSSTQFDFNNPAFQQAFENGAQNGSEKNAYHRVRAVRSF